MKQLFAKCALALAMVLGAAASLQAQQAFYVYRNDGMINGFITSDIDSMQCSRLDMDSLLHADFQVQEIYTPDSIYRIPLTVIDSISFVTPEPVYQPGVVQIDKSWYPYLIAATDSSLTFSKDVPSELLPAIGQVVVTDRYEEPLSTGFSGRVVSVEQTEDGILCVFEGVGLCDIYERLLVADKAESYNGEDEPAAIRTKGFAYGFGKKFRLPPLCTLEVPLKELFDIEEGDDLTIIGTLTDPSLVIDYFICVGEPNIKDYVKFKIWFKSEGEMEAKIATSASLAPDPITVLPIPIKVWGIDGHLDLGLFFKLSGEVNAQGSFPFYIDWTEGFEYSEDKGLKRLNDRGNTFDWKEPQWALNLDGSVFAGVSAKFYAGLLSTKAANVDVTACFGPELAASFTLASQDEGIGISDSMYELLQDTKVTSSLKLNIEPGYQIGLTKRKTFGFNVSFSFLETERPLVPRISNPVWTPESENTGSLTADVSEDSFVPVKLGWGLYENDELVSKEYFLGNYWLNVEWPSPNLSYPLTELPSMYDYKAYPLVKLFDVFEMRVPEYAEVKPRECPVKVDFQMENSYHVPGGFTNDGVMYDHKFEGAVKVSFYGNISLNDLDDWGYVYEDPQGNVTHISRINFSVSHNLDRSYAFYRNDAHSQARLYGYVKYKGDDEYYYEDPKDYELVHLACPDNNHPHMIDLGLPSGTKWSCCNVDATTPKEVGSFYAWGETEPTTIRGGVYWGEYKYGNGKTFTKYCTDKKYGQVDNKTVLDPIDDVAYVKWGNGWRMPTREEAEELFAYCNCEWVSLGRPFGESYLEEGMLVTGPNGNLLYMPVGRHDGAITADTGRYWTSSLDKNKNDYAHGFYFQNRPDGFSLQSGSGSLRCYGKLIRPVIR